MLNNIRLIAACSALAFVMVAPFASASAEDGDHDGGYYGGMDMHLICYGEGAKPNFQTVPTFHWSRRHHELETNYATIMSRREFDGMVQIDIHGDEGHIWLPKKLIPPMHSGGQDGWWELYNLEVGYSEIHAKYRLNGLNKPKIKINRQTGHISINGIEDFRGTCEEHHAGEKRRF